MKTIRPLANRLTHIDLDMKTTIRVGDTTVLTFAELAEYLRQFGPEHDLEFTGRWWCVPLPKSFQSVTEVEGIHPDDPDLKLTVEVFQVAPGTWEAEY